MITEVNTTIIKLELAVVSGLADSVPQTGNSG